jgi:hypothetical protein
MCSNETHQKFRNFPDRRLERKGRPGHRRQRIVEQLATPMPRSSAVLMAGPPHRTARACPAPLTTLLRMFSGYSATQVLGARDESNIPASRREARPARDRGRFRRPVPVRSSLKKLTNVRCAGRKPERTDEPRREAARCRDRKCSAAPLEERVTPMRFRAIAR